MMRPWERVLFDDEESALKYYKEGYRSQPRSSVAKYWIGSTDFRLAMFRRAGVGTGDKLLLVSEDNDRCELTQQARDIVGPDGELVSIDVMQTARTTKPSYWEIYTDAGKPYDDGYFDAAVSTTAHHMADAGKEMRAQARVVKTGGGVVYADNGPGRAFFEAAKQDAHLEVLAQEFITWMGVRFDYGGTLEEGYEKVRKWGTRFNPEDIAEEASKFLDDVDTFEWKGLWLVSGKKRKE